MADHMYIIERKYDLILVIGKSEKNSFYHQYLHTYLF